jgi:hypothetical protein
MGRRSGAPLRYVQMTRLVWLIAVLLVVACLILAAPRAS